MNKAAQALKEWQHKKGLSATGLADRVGVTSQTISHLKNGKRLPSLPLRILFEKVMKIPRGDWDVEISNEK